MESKTCSKCDITYTLDGFNRANRRDGYRSWCKRCDGMYLKQKLAKLKQTIYEKLGNTCSRCGFSDPRALQIDHVRGGGNKEHTVVKNAHKYLRKVIEDTEGLYQILCANCNWIKRHENQEVIKEYRLSEQGRKAIYDSRVGWTPTEEQRQRMSDSHKGKTNSQAAREKLRETTAESWKNPEIREKRLQGMRKSHS